MNTDSLPYTIAVIIPCYNEALTIVKVINKAKAVLPNAHIYVFDNNSTDGTAELAEGAGATVRKENRQGKGFAIRQAFTDLEEDIFIIVDGDDTYDLAICPQAISSFRNEHLDFLNISRVAAVSEAYRKGHVLGNKLLTGTVSFIFGKQLNDMLSGFKILSKRFVKSFPISSTGFEIETELLIHALELGIRVGEFAAVYKERPQGSFSKLSTYKDGFKILLTIIRLVQLEKPLLFFFTLALLSFLISLTIGLPVIFSYFATGLVERFPSAILAGFMALISVVLMGVGLTSDLVQKGRTDQKKLALLAIRRRNDVL